MTAIKLELKKGPITTAITVAAALYSYKGGVLDETLCANESYRLDHSVVIIGYGMDCATGNEYWIMKNSWGKAWGENGFFRLKIAPGPSGYGICLAHYYLITANLTWTDL